MCSREHTFLGVWNFRRVVSQYSVPFLNLTLSFLLLILLSYSGVVVAVCYYHFVQFVLCVNTFFSPLYVVCSWDVMGCRLQGG